MAMKAKTTTRVCATVAIAALCGCTLQTSTPISESSGDALVSSAAEWVSRARTVRELVGESDAIVMAEVVVSPVARLVTQDLPQMNAEGTPVAVVTDEMLFSDTELQVLEVYSGTVPNAITVMQTGGVSPSTGLAEGPTDDPLYEVGEVYVLFLVDISGDPIQAPNVQKYITVSPAGRFIIDGSSVRSYWLDEQVRAVQPATLDDLVAQIRQASP